MDKLIVTAHLRSPLILGGGYLTLDGLLAARLFDELQDVDAAHAAIPVRCSSGVYHASAALTEGAKERVAFIAALRPTHSIDPDLIKKNKRGELHKKFDSTLTNVMNSYTAQQALSATWYVEGDAGEIQRLLAPVQFIGKRRASGFGQVVNWTFEAENEEGDSFGLEDPFGGPLRPIPVDLFKGDKTYPVVDAAWRPAYWNPMHRAACYAPILE